MSGAVARDSTDFHHRPDVGDDFRGTSRVRVHTTYSVYIRRLFNNKCLEIATFGYENACYEK